MTRPSSFELIAGDPVLDLVNTVSWRGDPVRRIERIPDFASLVHWATRAGLIDAPAARRLTDATATDRGAGEASARAVRVLREDLYQVIAAHLDGGAIPASAMHRLKVRYLEALERASVSSLPLAWEVLLESSGGLADTLTLRTVRLLESDAVHRIGRCSDRACGWVFIDHSRNHSRRWCSSTDCGNRDRAARHYVRNQPVRKHHA